MGCSQIWLSYEPNEIKRFFPNCQSIELTIHNKDDVLVIIISVRLIKVLKKLEKSTNF